MNLDPRKVVSDPRYLVALGFGSGLAPWAPGTVGSLVAIPFALLFGLAGDIGYAAIVIVVLIGGIPLCDRVAAELDSKDPGVIVIDEFVGMWIALFLLPEGWYWLIAGFVLFRFFDILKPWPVNWFDEHLPGGRGIMMDDVAAGMYSFALIQITSLVIERVG